MFVFQSVSGRSGGGESDGCVEKLCSRQGQRRILGGPVAAGCLRTAPGVVSSGLRAPSFQKIEDPFQKISTR